MATGQPGWYPRPEAANAQWWWDGHHWTVSRSDYEQVPKPKRRGWMLPFVGGISLFVGVIMGYGMAANNDAANTSNAVSAVTSAPQKPAPVAKAPEKPKGPATSFPDGVWLVGTDIAPGTYRTKVNVTGMCYWSVGKPSADLPDKNDVVQGGRPTVTMTTGKEFKSQGCGDWVKVG